VNGVVPANHFPGSKLAVESGCTCDQITNNFGKGKRELSSVPEKSLTFWYVDQKCPMHKAIKGESAANIIKKRDTRK
jgi:hypothetical protein